MLLATWDWEWNMKYGVGDWYGMGMGCGHHLISVAVSEYGLCGAAPGVLQAD